MLIGWDIGGAHVKAAWWSGDSAWPDEVLQWPCPLWQGLQHLHQVLQQAAQRWPGLGQAQHALTMTGEMADLFADRRSGVQAIADALVHGLALDAPGQLALFCGPDDWCPPAQASARWADIASANWLATAHDAARQVGHGVLVDIGSTTTDLILLRDHRVQLHGRTDAARLASGELVYHGVVRTPLCALGPGVSWQGGAIQLMNEFFATSADVYRLTGELDPAHDQQPAADQGAKTLSASRTRLARMIGMDASEATADAWLMLARQFRTRQVLTVAGQLRLLLDHARPAGDRAQQPGTGTVVAAGCGAFLVTDVLVAAGLADRPVVRYGALAGQGSGQPAGLAEPVPGSGLPADSAEGPQPDHATARHTDWATVCAPAVAVGRLRRAARAERRAG